MRMNNFFKNNIIMFVANTIGSFFNLLYQLMMLRLVSASIFASLNSLLSLLVIISVPTVAFTTMVTKHVSASSARQEGEKLKAVWQVLAKHALIFSFCIFSAFVFLRQHIANYLHIDSVASVMILAGIFFITGLAPVINGGLQGLEKFKWLAIVAMSSGLLKLLLSIGFVKNLSNALEGALLGFLFSGLLGVLISLFPIGFLLKGKCIYKEGLKKLYIYILPVSLVSLCFALLTNIDMVLVKHFFMEGSQDYAVAQMIGKIILFIPGMVYVIMFSRVSSLHAVKRDSRHILWLSLIFTFILSFIAVGIYNLFPGFILKLLSGTYNAEAVTLARYFSFAMLFLALSNVLFFYQLSVESYNFIKFLILMTMLQIVAISLFHNTPLWVISIVLFNSILIFLLNLNSVFRVSRQQSRILKI